MFDVTKDRNLYLGGSDIATIMGISPFKSRFDLLLEKAGYKDNDFVGNEYTEYGHIIEPKIREFINETEKDKFIENKTIENDLRYHSDGVNKTTVLEIKSTSQIKKDVNDYRLYLVQLLLGMQLNNKKKGKLAVYERPSNFDTTFNSDRLTVYDIDIKDYKDLLEEINEAIERFRIDLEKVKANPFLSEEDLQPNDLVAISNKVVELELQLAQFKELEKQHKEFKEKLKTAMEEYKVKKWTTENGTQITLVEDKEDEEIEVEKLNEELFIKENKELIKKYETTKQKYITKEKQIKKGRKGHVRITILTKEQQKENCYEVEE